MSSDDDQVNGLISCAMRDQWFQTQAKVDEIHSVFKEALPPLKTHLESIDCTNKEIRDRLINPATATGRVDVKVIMPIIYVLCFMLGAIIIWFTGVEPNLPGRSTGHVVESK